MGWSQLAISVLVCGGLSSFLPAATTPTLVSARRRVVRPPAPLPHPFLHVLGIGGTSCVVFTFYVPPDCTFQACRWTIPVGSTFRWSTHLRSKGTFFYARWTSFFIPRRSCTTDWTGTCSANPFWWTIFTCWHQTCATTRSQHLFQGRIWWYISSVLNSKCATTRFFVNLI